ncbi:MAG: ASKHA domain-containing protein [archaeon]
MIIKFLPQNVTVKGHRDESVLEAALSNGISITASCNASGRCGKCRVIVEEGVVRSMNGRPENGLYLACQAYPRSDLVIRIPAESAQDEIRVLHRKGSKAEGARVGIAVDLGTTTVIAASVDLETGRELLSRSANNYQIIHGEDILTRINFCKTREGLEKLHSLIISNVNSLIQNLGGEAEKIAVTGNTTMRYIFLGKDPGIIKKNIQIRDFRESAVINGNYAGLVSGTETYVMPGISNYVGGDIVADIIASGLHSEKEVCGLIDAGTNGEVVLGNGEWIICASTSAGPAFEGGEVHFGMRAMNGVIESVIIDDQLRYRVIGKMKPRGICGSGLIDLVSELFKKGIIDRRGGFARDFEGRLSTKDDARAFIVAFKEETGIGRDICITESEIRSIIMSKAAIYAGLATLMKELGVTQIKKLFVSGNFGNFLNIGSAIEIGLLPKMPMNRYVFIGNGALKGACMALADIKCRNLAQEIAEKTEYLDLQDSGLFMDEYSKALFLPHTEIDRFS